VVKAQVLQKQKQPSKTKSEAEVKRRTDELVAARLARLAAEQAVGERANDGVDTTAAMEALRQAENRVKEKEIALAVAQQRDQAELLERQKAERDARRESLRALLTELGDVGRDEVDTRNAEDALVAAKVMKLIRGIQVIGIEELNSKLVSAVMLFRTKRLDAVEAVPGCWTGQDLRRQREPWSKCLPSPAEADRLVK
jgi:hypothetical protein